MQSTKLYLVSSASLTNSEGQLHAQERLEGGENLFYGTEEAQTLASPGTRLHSAA